MTFHTTAPSGYVNLRKLMPGAGAVGCCILKSVYFHVSSSSRFKINQMVPVKMSQNTHQGEKHFQCL